MGVIAFIGLGANLGDPLASIEEALRRIDALPDTRLLRRAPLYGSKPWGPPDQPDFVNTVAEVETDLGASTLLSELLTVERQMGRTRTVRWGPRLIDLDLLLYGSAQHKDDRLELPHPGLVSRRFVLAPLADLDPDRMIAGVNLSVGRLLERLDDDPQSVWRL
jgi:2-amino-4-hydroxy-6-hydroxymethyldihydropteridine diphosphokinase